MYINSFYIFFFHLESSPNCTKDYLEVRTIEGFSKIANSTRFCGRNIPSNFISTSNKLQIVFRSNNNITADGFNLEIRPRMGGIYNVTNKSPKRIRWNPSSDNFYQNFPFKANFTFVTNTEHTLVIRFLPQPRYPFSRIDNCETTAFVNIYKWKPYLKDLGAPEMHCILNLDIVFSAQNQIMLEFEMKQGMHSSFQFEYYLESCNEVIRNPGWIYSPKGKVDISNECEWKIEAPENHQIKLSFARFNVGSSFVCRYSAFGVRVYKGNDSLPFYKMCGKFNETKTIKLPSKTGSIQYYSPYFDENTEFKVHVEFVKMCDEKIELNRNGKTLSKKLGNITDNYECNFYISAPEGFRIEAEFQELKMLGGAGRCKETAIELYESYELHNGFLEKLCKNEPIKFTSPENSLNILAKGALLDFVVKLTLKETLCGSKNNIILNDEKTETIQMSPYPANVYCKWTIQSDSYFDIVVDYLDLEPRSDVTGECLDELSINSFTVSICTFTNYSIINFLLFS